MNFLWFSPFAGLWPSFRMEHRLAQQLALNGSSVTMIHCDGIFSRYCPVMAAEGLSTSTSLGARKATCSNCRGNTSLVSNSAAYQTLKIESYISPTDLSEIDVIVQSVSQTNWMDFEVEGIPIGKYSSYISLLQHKLPNVADSEVAWGEYQAELFNSLVTYRAVSRILTDVNPTHAVVYNPLYPANRVFSILSERSGSKLIGLSAGAYVPSRYETVAIYPHVSSGQTLTESSTIASALRSELTPLEIKLVSRYLQSLINATDPWTYSVGLSNLEHADTKKKLNISGESAIAIVLLSSPDETRASVMVDAEHARKGNLGQPNISQFISMVRAAATELPEVHFVVRVHPRLYPNKRESVVSPDVAGILHELGNLPDNCSINTPEDNVSLYELIAISDVAINQSSSAGLEFLSLGVPVINCDPEIQGIYPPEFGMRVSMGNYRDLAKALEIVIGKGPDIRYSIQAFRWYGITLLRALLPLSNIFSEQSGMSLISESSPPNSIVSSRTTSIRRLIPESIRERVARLLDRNKRKNSLPDLLGDGAWFPEFLERIACLSPGPVWEPLLVQRGNSDGRDEVEHILGSVNELRRRIGAPTLFIDN